MPECAVKDRKGQQYFVRMHDKGGMFLYTMNCLRQLNIWYQCDIEKQIAGSRLDFHIRKLKMPL